MDILNFISWIRSKKILKTLPKGSLIPVGVRDTRRDDRYNTYAIKAEDLNLGGGSEVITLNTYQELYDLILNEELVAGNWYKFPYRSVNFLNGWYLAYQNPTPIDPNFNPREIYEGETEMLLFQAISSNEISPIGYSEDFSQDIITYLPLVNKIGVDFDIYNGQTLPDSSTVSGFDLQWDGTNVYFNMPTGYPALYGHYFYLYCTFDGGSYSIDGNYEPLNLNGVCQYPYTIMPKIKLENNGTKVILLGLTEQDYLNYDVDTLYVDHVYSVGDAYGWITRRHDTQNIIDVPFDFRGRKYRRFEVDLSSINSNVGTGYYGMGDNFLGAGTTGNFQDFLIINWKEEDCFDIEIGGTGGPDMYWYNGYNDNNVIIGRVFTLKGSQFFYDNTIGNPISFGTIRNTFGTSFFQNTIVDTYENYIGSNCSYNIIGYGFGGNIISNQFVQNNIGANFQVNNILVGGFSSNTTGNNFQFNTIKQSVSSTNFTSATHVYQTYNCEIFRRVGGALRLSYVDITDTVQYTTITA